MGDDIDDAFHQLRNEVSRSLGPPRAADIVRLARRRRLQRGLAAGSAAIVVAGIGVGISIGLQSPANHSDVVPIKPAPSGAVSVAPSQPPASPNFQAPSAVSSSGVASPAGAQPLPAQENVTTIALPGDNLYDGLVTDGKQLTLTGTVQSTAIDAACVVAPVDPQSLAVGAATSGECSSPAMHGGHATAVVTGASTNAAKVAIAHIDAATGNTIIGPRVMTWDDASDTHLVTVYGGGSLWLYDIETPSGAQAVEVSQTTGQVEDVVNLPQFLRPVVAADANGLWIGNSIQGSPVGGALFHVVSGSHKVTTVLPGSDVVDWLVADGQHVWAGVRPAGATDETLWRFDGSGAKPAFHVAEPGLFASTVVGSEADELWTAVPIPPFGATISDADNQELDVVRIDPDTGARDVEARLPALPQLTAQIGLRAGAVAVVNGTCYVLEPPFRVNGYLGYTQLAKVVPVG